MKIIKSSVARAEFQDLIDTVHYKGESIVITKSNKPWVAMRPLSEKELKEYDKRKKN